MNELQCIFAEQWEQKKKNTKCVSALKVEKKAQI